MKHTKSDIFTAKDNYLGLFVKGENYQINEMIKVNGVLSVYLNHNGVKISEHSLRWFELVIYFVKNK